MNKQAGLTFIEILIVLAIIALLAVLVIAGVTGQQKKASDVHIKSGMNQLRFIAEIAFDNQGASYLNWTQDPSVSTDITTLLEEIDARYGDPAGSPYVTATRESQIADFCISAPLIAEPGVYACIDATGEVKRTTSACPNHLLAGPRLLCP